MVISPIKEVIKEIFSDLGIPYRIVKQKQIAHVFLFLRRISFQC